MPLTLQSLTVGQLQTNCYIVANPKTQQAVVIDPGDDGEYISTQLSKLGFLPTHILLTHGHFDHVLAAYELQLNYNIPCLINPKDTFLIERMQETAAFFLKYKVTDPKPKTIIPYPKGEFAPFQDLSIKIIETPGHTPGSVSLYVPSENWLFTGDTLFAEGGVGRTDFNYSSRSLLEESIRRLFLNSAETQIYPGHGSSSTLKTERVFHTI